MDDTKARLLMGGNYSPVGFSMTCPNCQSRDTLFIQPWFCLQCGIEFTQADTIPCYNVQEYEADERIPEELLEYLEED